MQELATGEPIEAPPSKPGAIEAPAVAPPPHARIGLLRSFVDGVVPADASLAVVSCGIPELVSLGGRSASHFPAPAGVPTDGIAAIQKLERLASEGIDFLVVPVFRDRSWLDESPEFRRALQANRTVADRPNLGAIFELRRPARQTGRLEAALDNLSSRFRKGATSG